MSILVDANTTFIVQGITGREAVNLRLGSQLIAKMGSLSSGQKVILPADLTKVDDLIKGIGLELEDKKNLVPRPKAVAVPASSVAQPVNVGT